MPFLLIPLMFFIIGLIIVAVFAIGIFLLKLHCTGLTHHLSCVALLAA